MRTAYDILNDYASDIVRQLDMLSHTLVGHNTVLRTPHGLYLRRLDDGNFQPTGAVHCSRWTPEDAYQLAYDLSSKEDDHFPIPVNLKQALERELVETLTTIEMMKELNHA